MKAAPVLATLVVVVISLALLREKTSFFNQPIRVPKPIAIGMGTKMFFTCESLVDADINTGLLQPYDEISGRISKLNATYPVQIEGSALFLTGASARRFEFKIFSNDASYLGATESRPGIGGPVGKVFILNKSTGLATLTEATILGGSNDPTVGVSYMVCR